MTRITLNYGGERRAILPTQRSKGSWALLGLQAMDDCNITGDQTYPNLHHSGIQTDSFFFSLTISFQT